MKRLSYGILVDWRFDMSFIEFTKKNLMTFFIIVTCVTVAIAILGANFDKGTTFGYEAFYSPIIIGIIAVLPSFVLYSKKELSLKQMLLRRILHFIVLEMILIGFGYLTKILRDTNVTISFALSVFIIYLFTNFITWIIDSRTANEINVGLKKLQG